MRQVKGATNRR